MAGRTNLCERLFDPWSAHPPPPARRRRHNGQRRIILARDGDLRERRDVLLHFFEVQRVQQHVFRLSIRADRARDTEQNDRENDEDTQHHTEGIEEVRI